MLTNALNPALLSAQPSPAAPASPPSREPGAFGRELQRAADRAKADEGPQETSENAAEAPAAERTNPAPRGAAGTRGATNKSEARTRGDGKEATADAAEPAASDAPSAEVSVEERAGDTAAGTGEGRPEIAVWLQQWAQARDSRDPGVPGRATAAEAPGAEGRMDRATEALAIAGGEPAAGTTAEALIGLPAAPGDKARSGVQALAVAASGTPATTTQSLQALPAAGADTRASFAVQLSEAAQAVQAESVRVESSATSAATPGAASAAPAGPAAPAAVGEDRLTPPVGSREFAQALGARVAVFARNGIEQARLQVNPAEMGPIALQLALDGTQLRVDMVAEMAATRQMLEQALPTLASSLREAGLTLTGGGVFQQARDGAGDAQQGQQGRPQVTGAGADTAGPQDTAPAARTVRIDGLVDTYA